MSPRWESHSHLKIHEGCGGVVRWQEALREPGVGYTGYCLECHEEGIVVEEILPFEVPDGMHWADCYDAIDIADLRAFEWDPEVYDYDGRQAAFRELVGV